MFYAWIRIFNHAQYRVSAYGTCKVGSICFYHLHSRNTTEHSVSLSLVTNWRWFSINECNPDENESRRDALIDRVAHQVLRPDVSAVFLSLLWWLCSKCTLIFPYITLPSLVRCLPGGSAHALLFEGKSCLYTFKSKIRSIEAKRGWFYSDQVAEA